MTSLYNMTAMLEAYRDELERGGLLEQAHQLKGTELYDVSGVRTTLGILEQMDEGTEVSKCVRRNLIGMMNQYLAEARIAC